MALIELQNISKSYDGELVLDEFDLKIKENEFITLLGPSGCGKTTTLRILGGFETPDTGKVLFQGQDITHLAPLLMQFSLFAGVKKRIVDVGAAVIKGREPIR